jgi:hypothetical protein
MKKHWLYLKYVIRHKWFVFLACPQTGVSLWRALIHDWSKFLPCEWFAYVNSFYGGYAWKDRPDPIKLAFNRAWNHHQKFNKHHWQYWLLTNDSDNPKHRALRMPVKYAKEMVADWWGAGRAITGKWDAYNWYLKNKDQIMLDDTTRALVERLLADTNTHFVSIEKYLEMRRRIMGY